jgi:hypothetical protein
MVRWNQGRATWGVWGGVTPPKKSKKGGPNLRGGGSDMLELQFFLKMKDFFAENFGNFWKKVVLRKISGNFVFEKITSTSLLSGKFFWGALEWKGSQILEYTPPTGNRLARPWLELVGKNGIKTVYGDCQFPLSLASLFP